MQNDVLYLKFFVEFDNILFEFEFITYTYTFSFKLKFVYIKTVFRIF